MPLPPAITRRLLKATCDKTALDRRVLHLRRCLKEVNSALCPGGKKDASKHKKK